MTWIKAKTILKKIWLWLKTNWWFPVGFLLLVVGYATGVIDTDTVKDLFQQRKENHKKQIEIIEAQRDEEREIIKMSIEAQRALAEKFAEDKEKLTREHKKEIKKLAEEARGDKDEFGRKFAEKFGLEFRS